MNNPLMAIFTGGSLIEKLRNFCYVSQNIESMGCRHQRVIPAGQNLFKVRKITLEQRSVNVVLTLFCWLWTGFARLGLFKKKFFLLQESTESAAIQRIKESMKEEVRKFESENVPEYYNMH